MVSQTYALDRPPATARSAQQDRRDADNRSRIGRRTRARRTAAIVFLVGALVLATAVAIISRSGSIADDVQVIVVPSENVTLSFLGDTMFGAQLTERIEQHGLDWVTQRVDPFPESDVVIANLEGPLTTAPEPSDPIAYRSYAVAPSTVDGLVDFGIDAVSLANNHAMDRSGPGVEETRQTTSAAGIASFGAGLNSDEARQPLMIDTRAGRIAVVGMADVIGFQSADKTRPGTRRISLNHIETDLGAARDAGADYVVAFVHWGENYGQVDDRQRTMAQIMVEAGYDLIVGHGPHLYQPMEIIDGTPVFYSIGNFIFGSNGRYDESAPGHSLRLRASFDMGESMSFEVECLHTDNLVTDFQTQPCQPDIADAVLGSLNPEMTVADQRATITISLK